MSMTKPHSYGHCTGQSALHFRFFFLLFFRFQSHVASCFPPTPIYKSLCLEFEGTSLGHGRVSSAGERGVAALLVAVEVFDRPGRFATFRRS